MADEKPVPEVAIPPQADAPAAIAAPAAGETVAPAPAAEAPVVQPVVEAPVVEAPVVAEKVPSLLESAEAPADPLKPAEEKPVEAKPAEEKPVVEDKPVEEKPAEEVKPAEEAKPEEEVAIVEPPVLDPVDYKYELPEVVVMDDAQRGEFHTALDAFRANPVEGAQSLIEMHTKAMTQYAEKVSRDQWDAFADTKKRWQVDTMADEQIGGNNWNTAKKQIALVRDQFVSRHPRGSDEYVAERNSFIHMLDSTGAGDHPAMLKFLHNFARFVNEPAAPIISDVKQVPERGHRGGNPLHDNPRSTPTGR